MDYQVFDLVAPYIDKSHHIFVSLVCKDWLNIINKKKYSTPYNVLTTKSLLSYADQYLNLVCGREKVKETIIKIGNLESIKYLHTKTHLIHSRYFTCAARNGNLNTMKWILGSGCEFGHDTFTTAAKNGNLDNMKWLKKNGCPFGYNTFSMTAENGNLENMKWLQDNGCKFSKYTFYKAVENGNLDNMKWLQGIGCEYGVNTFKLAVKNGSKENMKPNPNHHESTEEFLSSSSNT